MRQAELPFRWGALPPAAIVATLIGAALVEMVTYWAAVRRYAVGTHGSWWLRHASDSTTLMGPRAWLLTHLVVVAAIVGIVVVATLRSTTNSVTTMRKIRAQTK